MLFSEWKKELKEMDLKDIKKQNLYELPLIEVFEILYEIEYKYNMILNKEFNGSSKRKENILNILEIKMNEIMDILPNTFINSYDEYLDGFTMETPPAMDIIQRPWQFIFQTLYTSMLKTNDTKDMKKHIEKIVEEITGKKPSDLFYKMPIKTYLRREFYKDIEGFKDKFKEYEDFGFVHGAFQIKNLGEKLINIKKYPIK